MKVDKDGISLLNWPNKSCKFLKSFPFCIIFFWRLSSLLLRSFLGFVKARIFISEPSPKESDMADFRGGQPQRRVFRSQGQAPPRLRLRQPCLPAWEFPFLPPVRGREVPCRLLGGGGARARSASSWALPGSCCRLVNYKFEIKKGNDERIKPLVQPLEVRLAQ